MGLIDEAAMASWTAWHLDKLAIHGASKAYQLAQELAAWARLQPDHYPKHWGASSGGYDEDGEEICQGYIMYDDYGIEAGAEPLGLPE
jgi:hypothetical protein